MGAKDFVLLDATILWPNTARNDTKICSVVLRGAGAMNLRAVQRGHSEDHFYVTSRFCFGGSPWSSLGT